MLLVVLRVKHLFLPLGAGTPPSLTETDSCVCGSLTVCRGLFFLPLTSSSAIFPVGPPRFSLSTDYRE